MDERGCLAAAQVGGGFMYRVEHKAAQPVRWSEIDSGASLPMTVTTDWPGWKPRSTCSGSHGLTSSSSATQKPTFPI